VGTTELAVDAFKWHIRLQPAKHLDAAEQSRVMDRVMAHLAPFVASGLIAAEICRDLVGDDGEHFIESLSVMLDDG
jgi:hypothetical protein